MDPSVSPTELSEASLATLEKEKEEELLRVQNLRVAAAAKTQRQRETELAEEREKLARLAKDFRYNLDLLEERDRDLDALVDLVERLKAELLARDVEISDARVSTETERERAAAAEAEAEGARKSALSQLRDKDEVAAREKREMEKRAAKERDEIEGVKKQLARRLGDVESSLSSQRRQMTQEFDEASRRRDAEWREKTETLEAQILAKELKERQLEYEVQLLTGNLEAKRKEDAEAKEARVAKEAESEKATAELNSRLAVRESRVKELESLLLRAEAETSAKSEEEERKRNSLSRQLFERDGQLEAAKRTFEERVAAEEAKVVELEARLEATERERRREEWVKEDSLTKKDEEIERLKRDADKRAKEVEAKIVDGMSERSGELKRTKEYLKKIMSERDGARENLDWYKRELATAGQRLDEMEKTKTQLEFDLEARIDDVRRKEILRNEDLVRSLTKQRDDAVAQWEEARTRLLRLRGQVPAAEDGADVGGGGDAHSVLGVTGERVSALREENDRLKAVVRQMREQSEVMLRERERNKSDERSENVDETEGVATSLTPGYVSFLENEVRRLKKENQDWMEKIELIKGAAAATRRSIPVCACATKKGNDGPPGGGGDGDDGDVGAQLWSIIQRQKAKIEQLQTETKSSSTAARKRLKEAVAAIRNLVGQKHRLIETNNRLRADILTLRREDGAADAVDAAGIPRQRLSPEKAELMQYRLTKEQLQFATKTPLFAPADHLEEKHAGEKETEKSGDAAVTSSGPDASTRPTTTAAPASRPRDDVVHVPERDDDAASRMIVSGGRPFSTTTKNPSNLVRARSRNVNAKKTASKNDAGGGSDEKRLDRPSKEVKATTRERARLTKVSGEKRSRTSGDIPLPAPSDSSANPTSKDRLSEKARPIPSELTISAPSPVTSSPHTPPVPVAETPGVEDDVLTNSSLTGQSSMQDVWDILGQSPL